MTNAHISAILEALLRGEIDCDEALHRVQALDVTRETVTESIVEFGGSPDAALSIVEFGGEVDDSEALRQTLVAIASTGRSTSTGSITGKLDSLTGEDRYELKKEHGRGGMGVVYLALDKRMDREVALKRLIPGKGSSARGRISPFTPASDSDVTVERFLREARITGQLEHPNIIPVHEIEERANGDVYYTMKFVHGASLADRLEDIERDVSLSSAAKLAARLKLIDAFVDVCNSLAYAHSKGVIHRDLKPDNIMLGGFGETLLVDWGLAFVKGERDEVAQELAEEASEDAATDGDARLTLAGTIVGTPAYMSPEQARGEVEQVNELSDIFSMGAVLFEIITSRVPIEGKTVQQVLANAAQGQRRDVLELSPEAPRELAAIADFAMQVDPANRPQSARDLAQEVIAWRDGLRVDSYEYSSWELVKRFARRNRGVLVAAALIMALTGGFLGYNAWQEAQASAQVEQEFQEALAERKSEIDDLRSQIRALEVEQLRRDAEAAVNAGRALRYRYTAEMPVPASLSIPNGSGDAELVTELSRNLLRASDQIDQMLRLAARPVNDRVASLLEADEQSHFLFLVGDLRLHAARVVTLGGGLRLAEQILDGTEVSKETLAEAREFVRDQEVALQRMRRDRIQYVLEDVRLGLSRRERASDAPLIDDYVFELVGYRDMQTIELLGEVLELHAKRANEHWESASMAAMPVALDWPQHSRDQISLCCRVLARSEHRHEAVMALGPLSRNLRDYALVRELVWALCLTRSPSAWLHVSRIRARSSHATFYAYQEAMRFLPEPSILGATESEDFIDRGFAHYQQGNLDAAVADLSQAINLDPNNYRAFHIRAIARLGTRETAQVEKGMSYDSVFADFARALRLNPEHADTYASRGWLRAQLLDYEGAIADCTKAIELDPTHATAYVNRAGALSQLNDFQSAFADATRAVELAPNHSRAYAHRGEIRLQVQDLEGALNDFTKAIEHDPNSALSHVWRGIARSRIGDPKGAIADYSRAIELNPELNVGYTRRAEEFLAMGDTAGALADALKAIEVHPEAPDGYLTRAIVHSARDDLPSAFEDYRRALELDPELAAAYKYRGADRIRQQDFNGAYEDFTRLIGLEPANPLAFSGRGYALWQLGDYEGGLADYRESYELAPSGQAAYQAAILAALASAERREADASDPVISQLVTNAFAWLEIALQFAERHAEDSTDETIDGLAENAAFSSLRSHQRWQEILQKIEALETGGADNE